jgi:hypothetical protein
LSDRSTARRFSVYGYAFALRGNCAYACAGLAEDFRFFADRGEAKGVSLPVVEIDLIEGVPDYQNLPVCDAAVYTPRNVVYRDGTRRIIDFGGRGLGIYDSMLHRFRMASEDPHLVYEAAYLFLLSQIGQALDGRGLHRLHALAMSHRGRAVLVLMPMGGGKSTLAAALLKQSSMAILSDDSPFIDRAGNALAFPLRLGMLQRDGLDVPQEHVRMVNRMEFGPKYLVNYSWFADRVAERATPGIVLLGRRTLAERGRLEPAPYRVAMRAMVPNLVVGLGLFQGLEYLLERSAGEIAGKAGIGWSRLRNARALVRRSKTFLFHMGRDAGVNAEMVMGAAENALKE